MKYLLSILCLFVLSCDSDGDSLTEDCSGLLGGNAYINDCAECMCGDNDPDLWECDDDDECEQDCSGEWGGDAEIDGCGECGGDDLNEEGYHCGDLQVLEDIIDLYPNYWGDNPNPLHILLSIYWENGRIYHINWGGGDDTHTLLPESFGTLSNLEYLNLSSNAFISLPDNFGDLSHLSYLSLDYNQLTLLPENFENLSNLEYLSLYSNQLTVLPDNFGDLSHLSYLNLAFNQLTSLPESICDISGGSIYVYGNILCNQYNYSCIDWFESGGAEQDQSNCCEGMNDEGKTVENWSQCTDYTVYAQEKWSFPKWIRDYFNPGDKVYNIFITEGSNFSEPWSIGQSIQFTYNEETYSTNTVDFMILYEEICKTSESQDFQCNSSLEEIENIVSNNDVIFDYNLYEAIGKYNVCFAGWIDSNEGYVTINEGGYSIADTPLKSYYVNTSYPF